MGGKYRQVARRVRCLVDTIHLRRVARRRKVDASSILPGSGLAANPVFNSGDGFCHRLRSSAAVALRLEAKGCERGNVVVSEGEGCAHGHGISMRHRGVELQIVRLGRAEAPVGTARERGSGQERENGTAKIGNNFENVHADATQCSRNNELTV